MEHANNQSVCEDSLGPIPVAILGEEDAQRVLELMHKFGEEFVRLFLTELIQAKEEMVDAQEKIDYLLRKLYGQNRERFVDPDRGGYLEIKFPC